MNQIRQIQTLNKRELEAGIYDPAASWHADYRDTAFVNFGGLPYNLTEGDVLAIFSQYGEPVFLKLARDKETGKSKGFGWLKYEDQRSCDLAVDNLGGAEIAGRLVRVDHARYKSRDDEDESGFRVGWEDLKRKERQGRGEKSESESEEEEVVSRAMIQEEKELAKLIAEHDEDDPMKAFLIEEKKKEVEDALQRAEKKERKHRHRHHHRSHRSHRSGEDEKDDRDKRRSRRDATPETRDGDRDRDRDRDRRTRERDYDRERHRGRRPRDEGDDLERRRDRDSRRDRDADRNDQRHRRQARDHQDDRHRRSHRRSRSRSPRAREDK